MDADTLVQMTNYLPPTVLSIASADSRSASGW